MSRRVWRLVDVDGTFSLSSNDVMSLSQESDHKVPVPGFYDVDHPTFNELLLNALKKSTSDTDAEVSLFSTVDMTQAAAPDGFVAKRCNTNWHVQFNTLRLRFFELLSMKECNPIGLISTSSVLHKDPHVQGDLLMRNELLTAQNLELSPALDPERASRFQLQYGYMSDEHVNAVREDYFSSHAVLFFLKKAVLNEKQELDSEFINECLSDLIASKEANQLLELKEDFSLFEALRGQNIESNEESQTDFVNHFDEWAREATKEGSEYLANLNAVLKFFNGIKEWPADFDTLEKRFKLFYSGKGPMLAHALQHAAKFDVIQIFDDKREVIQLAQILVSDANKELLGNKVLVALQVDDRKIYHTQEFYESIMRHTSDSLVLDAKAAVAAVAAVRRKNADALQKIKDGVFSRDNVNDNVDIWVCLDYQEVINAVAQYVGGKRYIVCLMIDSPNTVILYDAVADSSYRQICFDGVCENSIYVIVQRPEKCLVNNLAQRLNRNWKETFSLPRGLVILSRRHLLVHHYLGVPQKQDPWYSKVGYALGGFVLTPVKNFLKLPLEMLPRGIECVLQRAIDAVDATQWPRIVKYLIEAPLYLGLAPVKASRLVLSAILSPFKALKALSAAFAEHVWEPALQAAQLLEKQGINSSAFATGFGMVPALFSMPQVLPHVLGVPENYSCGRRGSF